MKTSQILALFGLLTLLSPVASGGQRLSIRVSPPLPPAPASLTIRARIEPNDENRLLSLDVDSASYHSTSDIPLDGLHAQRLAVHELRGLPSGVYEVRGTLVGSTGQLAT